MLFLREEAQLRQRAQSLSQGDAPPLESEPAENSYPGRLGDEAGLGVHLLPEGLQSAEGAGFDSSHRGTSLARI
jgi:hypothetical protein